jgi:DNA-binding NarL/FixJ family response regulator
MKNLSFPGLPRVLIVDDEDGVREGLRTMLQREGSARRDRRLPPRKACAASRSRSFDVVFLDLNLPARRPVDARRSAAARRRPTS